MKRWPVVVLLLILACGAGWYAFVALSGDEDAAEAPQVQTPFTWNDEVALANLACGGKASVDAKKVVNCRVCPAGSDFAGEGSGNEGGWTDNGVLTGSFTAPGQDEALLLASGCESHANNMAGDFLFRRTGGKWSLLRYAKGAGAGKDCLKALWGDGRDAVICTLTDMHQGVASAAVQLMTFDEAAPAGVTNDYRKVNFVVTEDGSGNCGFPMGDQKTLQFDSVTRTYLVPNATSRPSLRAEVSLARTAAGPAGVETCPAAPKQVYTVTWKNQRDHFEAAEGFVALAARAKDDCCELTVTQRVEPARY